MKQIAEKVLMDIMKASILKVTFFGKVLNRDHQYSLQKWGGDSRLICNISKINYLMLPWPVNVRERT